ncbi:MAG TPA: peptidoglycan DD-metalloendopeptidase family protein [Noviherbaspirillum sp.]|uniref:murein hydrolase activator EnvC family protein n=1 Tax=Noviherbaspirillum sp. TaxID=1926288 RepID=UPI002D2CD650|nr:peptidoglycan DD-metalloendopeptidase family protein [Noviherbaspirillum sp.]HYD96429.1 peptidoglycan DD-metalloendopeptidase family protein [Noviherbaspirillum sp.]
MPFLRRSGPHPASPPDDRPRTGAGWGLVAAFGLAALILATPAIAAKVSERTRQKRAAEAERAELQQKLEALKRDIGKTEVAKSHAADALASSEAAISEANRALHELDREQRDAEARLARLAEEQEKLSRAIAGQQKKLSTLLREQYVAGNEDRIKLLLSGDNPNRINRELQYMGYVSQAQARLIEALRANMKAVEDNKAAAQDARDELEEIAQEQRQQKTQLEKEKARRATLLAQLSSKLAAQRREAGNIERDEQRLAGLVDKLAKLIEEQQKADAAAREKRRQEQLARASKLKNDAQADKKVSSVKTAPHNPDAIDNDEPPAKLTTRNELAPDANVQDGHALAFASLRGQLRLPVKGDVVARFGSKRGEGPSWKGLFIRTPEGAEVKAVATGQVVFAEWLRGFGNLIIIDHGGQYMTIYGNNQAVLKRAGDTVRTGEIIASAGNSGGNEHSGLYFEMRHQGRAIDPLGWVSTR